LDLNIDWSRPANEIRRFVDAVSYPYLGARTHIGSDSVIVEEVTELEDLTFERRDVGKVCRFDNGRPVVVCGSGLLRLDRLVTGGGDVYKTLRLRVRAG
jgi:methionyl-tRNA formyltransferase